MPDYPDYSIVRSSRRSLSIQILPHGQVIVKAPRLLPTFLIKRFVEQKKEWIQKHLQNKPQIRAQKHYVEGETFLFMGKSYSLHLGNFEKIFLGGTLNFPLALRFRAQKELSVWYFREAKKTISQRVEMYAKIMNTSYRKIMFSDTSSKWGSCSPDNSLQFNWRLIMAPLIVIDYVVVHELAHTMEKNHGRDFWVIVRKYKPAYRQYVKWLRDNAYQLIH